MGVCVLVRSRGVCEYWMSENVSNNSLVWLDDEQHKEVTAICLCVCVFTALFMRGRVKLKDIRILDQHTTKLQTADIIL